MTHLSNIVLIVFVLNVVKYCKNLPLYHKISISNTFYYNTIQRRPISRSAILKIKRYLLYWLFTLLKMAVLFKIFFLNIFKKNFFSKKIFKTTYLHKDLQKYLFLQYYF